MLARPISIANYTEKPKTQIVVIWLLQLHDYPSHANSKNAVEKWL